MGGLWFPDTLCRSTTPAIRLVCIGGAGTGPAEFAAWPRGLPNWIEVLPVHLPGRGRRVQEHPVPWIDLLADALAEELEHMLRPGGPPWALFGHSFGSLIAYEATRRLTHHPVAVAGLIVSSMAAPHLQSQRLPVASDDEQALLQWVRTTNAVSRELLDDRRFVTWLVRDLRSALHARLTYAQPVRRPVSCALLALAGDGDPEVSRTDLDQWRGYTSDSFTCEDIGEGHFFLRTHQQLLLDTLTTWLATRARIDSPTLC